MAEFNGKNNLKTSRLAFERAKYRAQAFKEDYEHVYDFGFAERTFYGRVNRMLEPVVPNENFLRPISITGEDIPTARAMNFVVDQFKDLEMHFAKACRMGVIPNDDPILSSLRVKRAYSNPITAFTDVSEKNMRNLLDEYIMPHKEKINNFNDFLRIFMDIYIGSDINRTIILSDFMKSKNSNIFHSGLAIDIANLDFSEDAMKEQMMLNSPAFNYYMNLTKQYGFRVDQNNPGVIVSDLASPVTSEYRSRYLLQTVQSVFDKQYFKACILDLNHLEKLLIDTYNSYVFLNPYNTNYKTCNDNTIASVINIKNIDYVDYNNILLIYINMRNFFEGSPLSRSSQEQITRMAQSIGKYDKERASTYIEDQFKRFYNQKDGSLTYFTKRIKNT